MTITTTYGFDFVTTEDLDFTSSSMELTGLSDGGLAGVGNDGGHVDTTYFDENLIRLGANVSFNVNEAALDQLSNGNVVIAGEFAGGLAFRITGPTGTHVFTSPDIVDNNTSQIDVAALALGGFVVTSTDNFGPTDNDIDFRIYDNDGVLQDTFFVSNSTADDSGASVVGLVDGGFAIAWTRTIGAETEMWTAVYEADGSVRQAAAVRDTFGTVNTEVSAVALANGGFAVAYADNGWDGSREITLTRFDATGGFLGFDRVSDQATANSTPFITKLSNGMLAAAWVSEFAPGDQDVWIRLLDGVTGDPLMDAVAIDQSAANTVDVSAAGWGLAGLALSYENGFDVDARQLVRTVLGDAADNLVTGDDAVDRMSGDDGADTLSGMNNNDSLNGESGADSLAGGNGHDTLEGQGGADTLRAGEGNDLLLPGSENDSVDGGNGFDVVDYTGSAAVVIDLGHLGQQNTVGSGFDRFVSIEDVIGTAGADDISGDGVDNVLSGMGNNDTLTGAGGSDTLDGGSGADNISGGADADRVLGGFGADAMAGGGSIDTLDYSMFVTETFLDLTINTAQNTHSAGNDSVIGFENVVTGGGDDRIRGNGSANSIVTGGGADTIKAGGGDDILSAGGGDDVLNGGGGADTLHASLGRDEMRGGALNDHFVFADVVEGAVGVAGCDVIRDFKTTDSDRIDLSALDPGTLVYIGGAAFGGVGVHEVRVTIVAQGQLVQIDANGDGASDMDILALNSGLTGGGSDFIL